jgi:hypothetical protein
VMEFWECPECGMRMGVEIDGVGGPSTSLGEPPSCTSMGHGPVEMEQKLPEALPYSVDEMVDAGMFIDARPICQRCGSRYEAGQNYCTGCGRKIND